MIGQSISNQYQGPPAVSAGGSAGGMSATGPAIPVSLSARRGRVARTPRQRRRSPAHVLTGLSLVAVAVIAVAVMLMPVVVFVLVLLVVVFVLALLVLMFVGAEKGTSENVRNSHFVLPSFFTWELFPAAARRATSQFDISLGTSCHDPQGRGGQVRYSRTSAIYLHPRQCMLSSPVPATARS